VSEFPIVVDGRINWQFVLQTEMVVIRTVSGRDMNKACARCVFDERVAGKKFAGSIAEGVLIFQLAEMTAIEAADNFITILTAFLRHRREQ